MKIKELLANIESEENICKKLGEHKGTLNKLLNKKEQIEKFLSE
jgi:hypothetical protein